MRSTINGKMLGRNFAQSDIFEPADVGAPKKLNIFTLIAISIGFHTKDLLDRQAGPAKRFELRIRNYRWFC